MIEKLSQVQEKYSVTDKVHGTVTFSGRTSNLGKSGNRYLMLPAEGTAVKGLVEPHITIWGKNARQDAYISVVEFSWAGAKHVRYQRHKGTFQIIDIPTHELELAGTLKILLKLFLNASTIATFAIEPEKTATPAPVVNNAPLGPGAEGYKEAWPALGGK